MPSFELPLVLIAILAGTLAVTSAGRGAWVAIGILALSSSALEFSIADPNRIGMALRLSAIGIGLAAALPENLFEVKALRRDLAPSTLVGTLREHPVVVASAIAGLLLGLVPLALPIESSSDALRAAGVALLVVGLPPLLTSRFIEATTRAAVVTLAGTMLLRTSIFGALDPLSALAIGAGFTCILVVGGSVATRISNAEGER
ncbi:MAG: hypothetical protein RIS62_219 [Chloroflexota bacterium]|jgi:hypothetical protein|nr:hypothetical protein [Candidatus Aquidulcis sp.]